MTIKHLERLTELEAMPGMDLISSELTPEERQANSLKGGQYDRISKWLRANKLPKTWIVEYGWPTLLKKVEEEMSKQAYL